MPKPPAQPQLPPITTGPVNQVPCCHCGKPNNFHGHAEMLVPGNTFACDHCKQPMQIAGVRDIKFVSVRAPRGQVQAIRKR